MAHFLINVALPFLFTLGIIILVHEAGHLLDADHHKLRRLERGEPDDDVQNA